MDDRRRLEAVLVENLPLIDRIATAWCRRYGLGPDESEEFVSKVKERLVESDFAILRKFRGEAAIGTYLTVVIGMIFRDFRVKNWGRWRPSAAAQRKGPIAVRLETLVYRQRHGLFEAIRVLQSSGETPLSERELITLFSSLPRRSQLRPILVDAAALADIAGDLRLDQPVDRLALEEERSRADEAIKRLLAKLEPEDRLILHLRYWDAMTVADIARTLGIPHKPLYRRLEHLLGALREQMEELGISKEEASELIRLAAE
jgi:RNA polymerase sigma factor for flagellar operon FliA